MSITLSFGGSVNIVNVPKYEKASNSKLSAFEEIVVKAARMSTNRGLKSDDTDLGLLRYLLTHAHTSPLEMIGFTFEIYAPLFLIVHFLRHRTGKFNQFSARYSQFDESMTSYDPLLNTDRKFSEEQITVLNKVREHYEKTVSLYSELLSVGVPKEVARIVIPEAQMSRLLVQFDCNNLLKFFKLRLDSGAQLETRQYAQAMFDLVKPFIPNIINIWTEMNSSVVFSIREIEALKDSEKMKQLSKREQDELEKKKKSLE